MRGLSNWFVVVVVVVVVVVIVVVVAVADMHLLNAKQKSSPLRTGKPLPGPKMRFWANGPTLFSFSANLL